LIREQSIAEPCRDRNGIEQPGLSPTNRAFLIAIRIEQQAKNSRSREGSGLPTQSTPQRKPGPAAKRFQRWLRRGRPLAERDQKIESATAEMEGLVTFQQ
jgi:hypothetical protein